MHSPTSESITTLLMRAHTSHENRQQIAVGYIRVSTHEQAQEGVSLDAQRDKLRAYCKGVGIKLVEVLADEGISGGTMERPALQAALRILERGRANTLVVVKLDRLTRSVKDLCMLVDEYFAKDRYDLISLCGMVNTHTAAGRLMMLNLANYAQYERELISERTREAMQHMKAQGVRLGAASYGYGYSQKLDDKGRRILEPVATEQAVIRQMATWHAEGQQFKIIVSMLKEKGITARHGGEWYATVISKLLEREGHHKRKRFRKTPSQPLICDKAQAAERARTLREEGLSLREVGRRLRKAGFVPTRGGSWHASTVAELLTFRSKADPASAVERACALRTSGHSLRQIAALLTQEGYLPRSGGRWYPATISSLLPACAESHGPSAPVCE